MFKTLRTLVARMFQPAASVAPAVPIPIPIEEPITPDLAGVPLVQTDARLQDYLRAAYQFRLAHGDYPKAGKNGNWSEANRAAAKAAGVASPSTYFKYWGSIGAAWKAADAWGFAEETQETLAPQTRRVESRDEQLARMRATWAKQTQERLSGYLRAAYRFRLQAGRFPRRTRGNTGRWHDNDRELATALGVASPNTYAKHWGSLAKAWVAAETLAADEAEALA